MPPNLSSPTQVRDLLRAMDFQPSRVLGQNFLIDGNILRILLERVAPTRDDTILEVGPGLGVLTAPLLDRAGRVVAVEKDARLFGYLQQQFAGVDALHLLHGDILELLPAHRLLDGVTKVASNLPYAIAGRFLVDLCLAEQPPPLAVLTVQQEVADRLAARHGAKDFGALTVFVQTAFQVHVHRTVSASCFFPRPQVQSAIVALERREGPAPHPAARSVFRLLVRLAFAQRRKQMAPLLSRAPAPLRIEKEAAVALLQELGLPARARPEEIPVEAWSTIAAHLASVHQAPNSPR